MRDWKNRLFEIRFNHMGNMLSLIFKPRPILRLRYEVLYTLDFFRKVGCLVEFRPTRGFVAKEGWVYMPNYLPPSWRLKFWFRRRRRELRFVAWEVQDFFEDFCSWYNGL